MKIKQWKRPTALFLCVCVVFCAAFSTLSFAAETAGDANGDGSVNMKDVLALRQYLAGMTALCSEPHADANGDGSVNMKDVLCLRRYLAGFDTTLATVSATATAVETAAETETVTATETETATETQTATATETAVREEPVLRVVQGTDRTLGVWWWKQLDGKTEETREMYLDFLEKNGTTEIYYYCGSLLYTEANRAIVSTFVDAAMKHGMRVAYLFDTQEVINADNKSFENAVSSYNTYNAEHPETPLYAIHCDIEPKKDKLQAYIDNFIVGDVSVARAAGVTVELDLNMNWGETAYAYTGSATHTFDGTELPIYEILAHNCDCMCMMSYRSSAEKLVSGTQYCRAAAVKVGTKIVYGMAFGDTGEGKNVDFHLHGKDYTYAVIADLDKRMQAEAQPRGGFGYAIHHHRDWYEMRNFEDTVL